jgi:replicative DNA helicase
MECVQKRQEAFKNGTSVQSGIPTLFRDLDKIFGGFKAGHSIIIGARPGVGKTTIACNLIVNLCSVSDTPIGVFSLEMEKSELFSKIVFLHSEVDQRTFEDGSLNGERYQDLFLSSHKISKFPVFIDDTAGLNTALMYARAKLWKKKYDVKIIFIDYLQLLKAVGKFPNKNEEIGEVSRFLKKMAKDLKVCIVSLAQLNRDSEKNSRPISSDLRESGQIEQDADAIFMLHNPSSIDKYNKPGILEVCVTKNRFGKEGVVELIFNKETGKMRDQTNVVNPIQQKKQPEIDPYAQYTK